MNEILTITAFFDRRDDARRASDRLVAAGVPAGRVELASGHLDEEGPQEGGRSLGDLALDYVLPAPEREIPKALRGVARSSASATCPTTCTKPPWRCLRRRGPSISTNAPWNGGAAARGRCRWSCAARHAMRPGRIRIRTLCPRPPKRVRRSERTSGTRHGRSPRSPAAVRAAVSARGCIPGPEGRTSDPVRAL